MLRRQFLQTLNASGMGAILPASASEMGDAPAPPQSAAPPPAKDSVVVAETGAAWPTPKIGVVSVGGIGGTCLPTAGDRAGSLAYLTRTIAIDTYGVELHFMNADRKLLVGDSMHLLSAHAYGRLAASVSNQIAEAVAGLDMVLLVAGMAGSTGAGVAPIVAKVLRDQGILGLAFAVMPFDCEGAQRQQIAQAGLRELQTHVDAVIPFFNDDFAPGAKKVQWISTAAQQASLTFIEVCRSILNPVCRPGWVNIDFEDLRQIIFRQEGDCAFGFGAARGVDGAAAAVLRAIDHPLLGRDRLQRASAVLVAIRASPKALTLGDSSSAMKTVRRVLPPNTHVIYGAGSGQTADDEIAVSILANGIPQI